MPMSVKKSSNKSLKKSLKKLKKSHIKSIKKSYEGRGSATRGWSDMKPKSRSSRREMLSKCGKSCFLEPNELKYPICPNKSCSPSCKGIVSANVRAHQHKAEHLYDRINKLKKKYNC